MAFLPSGSIGQLAGFVNDTIARTRTPKQLFSTRRFTVVTPNEVWLWIAQRLDISLNVKLSISQAYKSVRT